jgi:hypothetical protein
VFFQMGHWVMTTAPCQSTVSIGHTIELASVHQLAWLERGLGYLAAGGHLTYPRDPSPRADALAGSSSLVEVSSQASSIRMQCKEPIMATGPPGCKPSPPTWRLRHPAQALVPAVA